MIIEQRKWRKSTGWGPEAPGSSIESVQLVLVFGTTEILRENRIVGQIKQAYPQALITGCSTAGEIYGIEVSDNALVSTAVHFDHSHVKGGKISLGQVRDSYHAGECLAKMLDPEGLRHVLALSDGLSVNGSDLVRGLVANVPEHVTVTGGLAGDGAHFKETLVLCEGVPENNAIAVVGLYGSRLRIGYGSQGGWDSFGPERLITSSKGNVLYELDGHSALELYKKYLNTHANGLPATGLLFPLSLRGRKGDPRVVRTILAVNEDEQSMTFAGDVPEGTYVQFMKANFNRLIDGASGAARTCRQAIGEASPDLALLISCVGRKLVLKQRVEEEVEGVREVLGKNSVLTGFYSYGEMSPFAYGERCELHNQTMTITTISEE